MHRLCHRCHAELPVEVEGRAAGPSTNRGDDLALFCPRCGAPQILLPDYMRTEDAGAPVGTTTGAVPPPRPQMVDWPVALLCAAPVALIAGFLVVGAQVVPQTQILVTGCVVAGAGVVLGLYRARRPLARIDGRVGLRVGLVTGMLMITAMGLALAGAGVVARFGLHRMAGFDAEMAKTAQMQVEMVNQTMGSTGDPELKQKQLAYVRSPEFQAGCVVGGLAILGGIVLLFSAGFGGFTGMLQTRRRTLRGGS